jgi:hypothetical protein
MLTKDQAIKLAESKFWESMSFKDIAYFQLFERLLCMPFPVFHEAVEKTLERPVFTHEFAFMDDLKKELLGEKEAPSLEDIINLIPEDKRQIIVIG